MIFVTVALKYENHIINHRKNRIISLSTGTNAIIAREKYAKAEVKT